ncbi:hypothetical protein MCOR27_008696 [Pyricularia oryzae]|uniref:Metallo-beta-lactamase domain-containing protein n=4 Tax=Pyricularia TaxID=48558 RepID=A0ABQ8N8I6_PYRGI|nr:uncharacterized protein MGG_04819 [Pyricularia oryzae 70-15]ELQ42712.1 hypothetical protein OOU_Y34scaffold00194g25 [Pyricularia oryzae Y34]KAH8837330.1 hypothetical protein MCOR01_010961 [Pyricularia oryzae]KAI6293003.1 hypothetical protein MCOR33_009457 [Pyricularia grisea]EHA53942.1 hypothetical protein MGG_04819 [Pyricularia oryzae 70-15]KAI6253423.1 hypothetical protein MCOR19_010011 [Pyricularia oryzae]
MALTIKHLNGDASFLLTFEPLVSGPRDHDAASPSPFRILLDPWITGSSTIFHSKISVSTHKQPACISSLQELPEPDLVVISQHKSDHCNEATLRQLPASGTKTLILAEPASARVIKSWKYFDRQKVRTIPKWGESTEQGRQAVVRIPLPPLVAGGEPGEVTVAFIPQRRDISGLHSAIGITYRPPGTTAGATHITHSAAWPSRPPSIRRAFLHPRSASPAPGPGPQPMTKSSILTPPETPNSYRSNAFPPIVNAGDSIHRYPTQAPFGLPPTPTSLRSSRSTSSLQLSHQLSRLSTAATQAPRSLSLLYSPHGISTSSLSSYVTSHLVAEAALPLTALLHCFDAVSNPWWLGGNILLGAPAGLETATALRARAWVSAHDGEKELKGIATALLKTKHYRRENIVEAVSPALQRYMHQQTDEAEVASSRASSRRSSVISSEAGGRGRPTEVLALGIGEQVVICNDGVWNAEASAPPPPPEPTWAPPPPPTMHHHRLMPRPISPIDFEAANFDGSVPSIEIDDLDTARGPQFRGIC